MDYTKLTNNLIYLVKEEQIKLGYAKESIRLYYPLQSLNRLLATKLNEADMRSLLENFAKSMTEKTGEIQISCERSRFCFFLSESFCEYVHQNTEQSGFLYDFIATIAKYNVTIEDIVEQFKKYSSEVCCRKTDNGEFDYVVYFQNGQPDEYLYCIKSEGEHMIYHRFAPEDYEELI